MQIHAYQIHPYILYGKVEEAFMPSPGEWLRKAILVLVSRSKARLAKAGVQHDVFHNHVELTRNTMARYSLVRYRQQKCSFINRN